MFNFPCRCECDDRPECKMPMFEPPTLAIIIACFNYADHVGRAIASVRDQADGRCEILVIDDGSTDASPRIIAGSGVPFHRIANGGQRRACLAGLARTRAPFVLFLDADDELRPGALATILDHLDAGVAKLQFALERVDAEGRALGRVGGSETLFRDSTGLRRRVLRDGVYDTPPTSGNVFRRDLCALLHEADYDEAVDGVILFAAPFFGDVVNLPQMLGLYRVHDRNDSGLGRPLEAARIARDLRRFEARQAHLARILMRLAPQATLAEAEATPWHREQRLHLEVASDRRPGLRLVLANLLGLLRDRRAVKPKAALALFTVLAALLPKARARAALAYRLAPGRRSPRGLVRAVLAGGLAGKGQTDSQRAR